MESYNLLHARNELAHGNRMMLQASGTLGLLVIYHSQNELEDFLSLIELNKRDLGLSMDILLLSSTNAEKLHHHLLENDPELYRILLVCLKHSAIIDFNELFIGQEVDLQLDGSNLKGVFDPKLEFDLETHNGRDKWEAWLSANAASHEIEYYEPGMD